MGMRLTLTASTPRIWRPVLVVGVGEMSYIASMSDVEHDGDVGVLEKTMKEGEVVGSRMGVRPAVMTGSTAACKCGTRTGRL